MLEPVGIVGIKVQEREAWKGNRRRKPSRHKKEEGPVPAGPDPGKGDRIDLRA